VYTTLDTLPCVRQVQIDYDRQQVAVEVAADQYDEVALVTALWEKGFVAKPPVRPLLAIHGLWAFALVGIAVAAAWKGPTSRLFRFAAYALSAAGLATLALLVGRELQIAHSSIWFGRQAYIGPRLLYALALHPKLPAVQAILAGAAFGMVASWRNRPARPAAAEAPPSAPASDPAG
jgi:hypothetical protein